MMVVTTNDIPGWEIQRVCGEVFGLTVRSRNAFSQLGAGFKSMFGGELQGMTRNLIDSRNEVMGRMLEAARQKGGNAVIAMRFDTSEMADTWTELCAYGTAVVAVPVSDAAKETARAMGYGAPGAPPQQPQQPQPAGPPPGYQQPAYPQGPGPAGPPPGYQSSFAPPGYPPQGPQPVSPQGPATGQHAVAQPYEQPTPQQGPQQGYVPPQQ